MMEAKKTYEWAQEKLGEVTAEPKRHREARARERRLRQIDKRREKATARKQKAEEKS